MNSQVNWSLLGLVIKRPSYAYELAQRFERTYEHVVSLSSVSHIYTALAGLKDRSLIEQTAGSGTEAQRKPIYKATEHGIEEYRRWLLGTPAEEQRLVLDAKLAWVRYARGELEAFSQAVRQ